MPSPLDMLRAYKPGNSPSSSSVDTGDSEEGSKEDQTSAGYLPPEDGPFKCSHCSHFQAPNACDKVSGMIDPEGCCNYYLSVETGSQNPGGENGGNEESPAAPTNTAPGTISTGGPSIYGR